MKTMHLAFFNYEILSDMFINTNSKILIFYSLSIFLIMQVEKQSCLVIFVKMWFSNYKHVFPIFMAYYIKFLKNKFSILVMSFNVNIFANISQVTNNRKFLTKTYDDCYENNAFPSRWIYIDHPELRLSVKGLT